MITSTFSENGEQGTLGTFARNDGAYVRSDYILVMKNVVVEKDTLRVLRSFKMSNFKPDHLPIEVQVRVFSALRAPFARRRVAEYDRAAVRAACDLDPDAPACALSIARDGFAECLQKLPFVSCEIDPTSHSFIILHQPSGLEMV